MWPSKLSSARGAAAFSGPTPLLGRAVLPHALSICKRAGGGDDVNVGGGGGGAKMNMRSMPAALRPVVPSPELKKFVEDKAQRRSEIVKALSTYARTNGLQNPENKRMIQCDDALISLLGVRECSFLLLSKYVAPHLSKPEEIGGKYIDEAKRVTEEYFLEKEELANNPPKSKKRGPSKDSGRGLFKPVTLSPALQKICGGKSTMIRPDILKSVWDYIRSNNLKGPPGTPIKCDAYMQNVFESPEVTPQGILKGISKHLS